MKYEKTSAGVIKRSEQRAIGIFIDGTGLDRATRRINKKISMQALLKNLSLGLEPVVARYYTLIPYEDDSRQRAYLDAVQRAGFQVVVKRLPPKGITRQVLVDTEMSADIVAFAFGYTNFSSINELEQHEQKHFESKTISFVKDHSPIDDNNKNFDTSDDKEKPEKAILNESIKKIITIVCPSQELTYSISLANDLHAETVTADFGKVNTNKNILKSASKWVDLSDSETIWRD